MDLNPTQEIAAFLQNHPEFSLKLRVYLDEELKSLSSVMKLDPALPNLGLQALSRRTAHEHLAKVIDEIFIGQGNDRKNKSFA